MKSHFFRSRFFVLGAAVLLSTGVVMLSGCKSRQPNVTIGGARAELSPAIIGEGLVYMKIVNTGGPDRLIGAKTSIPGTTVALHEMEGQRMVMASAMPVPSGATVELKPMGSHIMIENMPKTALEGYQFTLTLTFEKSGEKQIPLVLMKAQATMKQGHQM